MNPTSGEADFRSLGVLEQQFQRELYFSGSLVRVQALNYASRIRVDTHALSGSYRARAILDRGVRWGTEIWRVEQIEYFRSELYPESFGKRKFLKE